MRILIDFRSYQLSKYRGIGRYIQGLAEAMIRTGEADISLAVSNRLECIELSGVLEKKVNIYTIENWENYIIDEPFDFFFKGNFFEDDGSNPDILLPVKLLKKCKNIVGINYDLIPLIFTGNYLLQYNTYKNYPHYLSYLNYAEHIFCISECTKIDAVKFLNRPESDFTVIYGGADKEKFESSNSNREYNSKERTDNIVFIAGDDRRKNYQGAARAFAQAFETGKLPKEAKLYLICRAGKRFINDVKNELKGFKAKLDKQVIITNFIPDNEVKELLSNARASIFPSFYEGLGLPIIESYIAGTPAFASNLSSTKEFVNKESAFNPYDDEEFKNVIIRIYNDEEFLKQSLEYGRTIVKNFNWDNSARIVLDKLKELKEKMLRTLSNGEGEQLKTICSQVQQERYTKTAVFTILPPETSGIAPYSYKTHTIEQEKYDIFSDIKTAEDYAALLNGDKVKNIFPLDMYDYINFKEHYKNKIFVLGDSSHHKKIFKTAVMTKGEPNRCLYLHEAFLWHLLHSAGFSDIGFMKNWYPAAAEEIDNGISDFKEFAVRNGIFGIRAIVNLTGITNIIVNNERAEELIRQELNEEEYNRLNIHVLFLPIEEIKAEKLNLKSGGFKYTIGTFGMPSKIKLTSRIIEAVQLLNREDNSRYKLIIAGYEADKLRCSEDFVQIIDSPGTQDLYNIMNSVDLAVQLRPNPRGESSGCVCQLLGLGQNIMTSEGFVNKEISRYCHRVKGIPSIEELACAIKNALENPIRYDNKEIIEKYGFKALSEQLYLLTEKSSPQPVLL